MEQPLTEWEQEVLTAMASVDRPGADIIVESIPHLVVTHTCDCGCRSFDVRDSRHEPHEGVELFSNAIAPDGASSFMLLVDSDGRPRSIDDLGLSNDLPAADPKTLIVSAPES